MYIPEFIPNLTFGAQRNPDEGGCLMQVTSYLYNGAWNDSPPCTDRCLGNIAIQVNDSVSDEARRGLYAAVADLSGTAVFGIGPEAEDVAVTELERWTRETLPYGLGDMLMTEAGCDGCCERWNCLAERVEALICHVTGMSGQCPNYELVERRLHDNDVTPDAQANLVAETFGPAVAATLEERRHDWRERQDALVTWFVAFVRKYREVFDLAPAKEIVEADWRRVADHMAPA